MADYQRSFQLPRRAIRTCSCWILTDLSNAFECSVASANGALLVWASLDQFVAQLHDLHVVTALLLQEHAMPSDVPLRRVPVRRFVASHLSPAVDPHLRQIQLVAAQGGSGKNARIFGTHECRFQLPHGGKKRIHILLHVVLQLIGESQRRGC